MKGQVHGLDANVGPSIGNEPCFGTPSPDMHQTAYLSSPEFGDATTATMVFSVARAFDNASWAVQEVANELGPNGARCLTAGDQQVAAILHRTNIVDSTERPSGSPKTVRAVTHRRFDQPGPQGAEHVSEDSYLLTQGRFEVTLNFQSIGGTVTPTLERGVISQLAARLATQR